MVVQTRPAPQPVLATPEVLNITVQPNDELLLTVEEAARRLSIGRSLMYQLIRDGRIETVTVGRLRRVEPNAIERFVDGHRSVSQQQQN